MRDVKELYADGTFKCCQKFFTQLYTIYGSMVIKKDIHALFMLCYHTKLKIRATQTC